MYFPHNVQCVYSVLSSPEIYVPPNVRIKTNRFSSIERWRTRARIDVNIDDKMSLYGKNTTEYYDGKKIDLFNY